MKRILVSECVNLVDKKVKLAGWLAGRRLHGKLIFLDLRDVSGILQLVVEKDGVGFDLSSKLGLESVIEVEGKVVQRPKNLFNPKIPTGHVELAVSSFKVLAQAAPLPFEVDKDTSAVKEELRLKYRYLDLRSERLKSNLKLRQEFIHSLRNRLKDKGFFEIETPILTKSTPEGARDFVVPSRVHPGKFYALPQSPQQYKQLLMVAGFERYFQIARCFRDEDPRADRTPEFTQLDIEMSFVDEEDIITLTQEVISDVIQKLFPHKKQTWQRITYSESMSRFRTDRPDLRKDKNDNDELSFVWVVEFPLFEWKPSENQWGAAHHPFTAPHPDDVKLLDDKTGFGKIRARQYDLALNGFEIGGGSIRTTDPSILKKVFQALGHSPQDTEEKFGHLLQAFKFGVPPHGGIASGLDRVIAILAGGEKSIREVIAFPKTGEGYDLMMDSPDCISDQQLKELYLKSVSPEGKKDADKDN